MSPEAPGIAGWSESLLLEEKRAKQRVALHGTEAGVANGLPQLFFVGLVGASGGGHYVLLDQDAAQIVTAIAQRHLSKLDAGRKPTGLHVIEIRSEEHTSELQSPCNLVCRLLLEKKKKL